MKRHFLSAVFAMALLGNVPSYAASLETVDPAAPAPEAAWTFKAPLILSLSYLPYSDEAPSQVANLNEIEPAAGEVPHISGGMFFGIAQEKGKDGVVRPKLEFTYSPVENVRLRAKHGGLVMYKKFAFEPTPARAHLKNNIRAEAPSFD